MKKTIILFSLLSTLLTSCGAKPDLWGQYSTPTPEGFAPAQAVPLAIITATPIENQVLVKTSPTPQPTSSPLQNTATPTQKVSSRPTQQGETILYYSQSGDTLEVVAIHFDVT